MKKYDCSKTLDYAHELSRMCDERHPHCWTGCPLGGGDINCDSSMGVTQEQIDIVQKWSDEHPEPPRLTKQDRAFLECFARASDRKIAKDGIGNSFYNYEGAYSKLSDGMFKALEPSTTMTFEELLKLEVED